MRTRSNCYRMPGDRNRQVGSRSLSVFITICLLFSLAAIIPSNQVLGRARGLHYRTGPWPQEERGTAGEGKEVIPLEPGKTIKRELAGGQEQNYRIRLNTGQFLKVIIEQQGIDVAAVLSGPDGKPIVTFNGKSRIEGQELVSQVAEVTGEYRLTVQPAQKEAPPGSYEIRIDELRVATESDRKLQEARNLYEESRRLYRAGKYDEGFRLGERALEIREKRLGPDHLDVAAALNNLALLYYFRGNYTRAELLLKRTLAIREKVLGPEYPEIAYTLNNLANLYGIKGDYYKAEPLYQRALAIMEKGLGPDHPDVTGPLNNLANIYGSRGDYAKAEPLYRRTLAIREKALGPDHPDVADAISNLAITHLFRGNYTNGLPLAQRALAIREKALGPDHPYTAASLNNLALLYHNRGDYAKAEPLAQRALAIREKALGPEQPDTANSFSNLAALYAANGDPAQAIKYQARANAIGERNLAINLAAGSEREKLAYLALFSYETDFTLSLHTQVAPRDPLALDLAFTTWLRRKGRGLDAMADTIGILRRRAAPQDQQLFDQLAEARSQLATLMLAQTGVAKPEVYRAQFQLLNERVEELEATVSSRSVEFRTQSQPVTLGAVQAALSAGSALIDFAVYTPQEPRSASKHQPPRYVAFLLAPQGRPQWVDLGEAAAIDRAVETWRMALRDPRRTDVKRLARDVDEKVMRPVRALLQSGEMRAETHHLLISPDGLLNLIPFAALVDEQGRYLVERYSISYLVSGRDLLRLQVHEPYKSEAVVVADPDYGETEVAVAPKRRDVGLPSGQPQSADSDVSLSDIYFPPLKGAAVEARALKAILPQAKVLTRRDATEARLKRLSSPRILHLATHGFFLRDQESELADRRGVGWLRNGTAAWTAPLLDQGMETPLLRSGLALVGANLRRRGTGPEDDGILTALEAAGLDLWGTKLVVLSACDTGVGEVKNGEGVYGLRRALVLAGSETQVMSLWPVSDLGTRDLMIGYYKALRRGEGRGEGLRKVQLEMLKSKDRRHPFYWASFIQSGEWANLEGKRQGIQAAPSSDAYPQH